MANLLDQAISSDDPEEATKIIQSALGIEATTWQTTASQRLGRKTGKSEPASSHATGMLPNEERSRPHRRARGAFFIGRALAFPQYALRG